MIPAPVALRGAGRVGGRDRLVAVVRGVDRDRGSDELVDAVEHRGIEGDLRGGSWLSRCSMVRGPMFADVTAG